MNPLKFLHLSDLHLGRRLYDASLLEDQQFILAQILGLLDAQGADAVILAGDIYDKAVPSAEAVRLLDWFLTQLADRKKPVFMVSGNHDSAERIAFGANLFDEKGVFVSPVLEDVTAPVTLHDAHGPVHIYLLPFVKPIHVRRVFPETEIGDYTEAVEAVVKAWSPKEKERNVLVAHQLVTGAVRSESESVSIGGLDDVSAAAFSPFDYVALGHLHRAQSVCRETVRYCGTPLAYSFSEEEQKSVTWVELGEKGSISISQTPLVPLHPVRTVKGLFDELMKQSSEDYLRMILLDEDDVPYAMTRLRHRYPNLLRLEYDNLRTRAQLKLQPLETQELSPLQMLEEFYRDRNDRPMPDPLKEMARAWMAEIWEDQL